MKVIVLREREGKSGGGKGALLSEDVTFTLSTSNFHVLFLFEATRVEDVRIYEDYSPTVARYWGTGGARVPYVYAIQGTMIGRQDHNGPGGPGVNDEVMYTLTARDNHAVGVVPIQDARELEKKQNGLGIGEENDPSYTVDTVSHQAVAYAFDDNQNGAEELMGTLMARTTSGGVQMGVSFNSTVRRLTPIECERLQGFPDNWTDGQADSHRYKQMGNAVAVPVVQWIINRLV